MLSLYQKSLKTPNPGLLLNSVLRTSLNKVQLNSKNLLQRNYLQNQLRFESTSSDNKVHFSHFFFFLKFKF